MDRDRWDEAIRRAYYPAIRLRPVSGNTGSPIKPSDPIMIKEDGGERDVPRFGGSLIPVLKESSGVTRMVKKPLL
jgi:hypothetical protein